MSITKDCTLDRIKSAGEIVYRFLQPSPLLDHPLLSKHLGINALVKHENHLPTGAFKVRGGLNFLHHYHGSGEARGVISATRGNHGQSIAFAASKFQTRATIVVPFGNNPEKNAAMSAFGAEVIEHGRDFDEARAFAAELADAKGLRYIHSANEPDLINGVGTYALEILQALGTTKLDAIFVPIGMGSGICGVITAFRALSPQTRIFGVQSSAAPSYHLSLREGKVVNTDTAETFADGVATRCPSEYTLELISEHVEDIVLVSDEEIEDAIRLAWRTTHNLAEGAGAIALGAVSKLRSRFQGGRVAAIFSGGNLDTSTVGRIFTSRG